MGFAIPINKVKTIIAELKEKGKIDRDFEIGMRIQSIDESIAKYYNLERTRGVIITKIYPGTSMPAVDNIDLYIKEGETLDRVRQLFVR